MLIHKYQHEIIRLCIQILLLWRNLSFLNSWNQANVDFASLAHMMLRISFAEALVFSCDSNVF